MVRSKKREDVLKRAVDMGGVEMVIEDRAAREEEKRRAEPAPVQQVKVRALFGRILHVQRSQVDLAALALILRLHKGRHGTEPWPTP